MKKEEKENYFNVLKKNPSLEPIADLLLLTEKAQETAKEAAEIGDKLSTFAARAEAGTSAIPAVEPWMDLCDYYKDGAREFAAAIKAAIRCSRIHSLPEQIKQYSEGTFDKIITMIENDPKFRNMLEGDNEENED